jgi:ATP-dependent Clp protease ATP-binding subunit ClpA
MFEKYTENARRVIFFARYEASQFGGAKIETEHLLLGLLKQNTDLIGRFAPDWKSIDSISKEITSRTPPGEKLPATVDMPLSEECKRILAYATEEAERLSHSHIGPEHLLLGILRESGSVAAQVLNGHGLKLDAVRKDVALNPSPADLRQASTLPAAGCVPDAETAKQIARVIWRAMYSEDVVLKQEPLRVEFSEDIWTIRGSSAGDAEAETLIAVISKKDSRILKVGTVVFRRDYA